ncbi:MAG: ribose-5-phosphate isomerase RpiA [Planctomycetaceae bacterium]|nr:ribose-5-phosphate isomerase RpiA [Planctomycetaceae bacterium]
MLISERAVDYIRDGDVVGLGTGRAAFSFIRALGERVRDGLQIQGVPTSCASTELAEQLGIPLTTLDEVEALDICVDGADEVDPRLNLIKGYGGALLREKIVATAAKRLVILVGTEKLVARLGARGILPVEVVPFALGFCRRQIAALGCRPEPRQAGDQLYVTDNGNHILDCKIAPLPDAAAFERALRSIPGVVGTGLFLGMAHEVLVQDGDEVVFKQRS